MPKPPASRTVGFLLVPGFSLLSYASAVEPLRAANLIAGAPLYRWRHAAPADAPAAASNGVALVPDLAIGADASGLDLLLVCAGGDPSTFRDRAALQWLRRLARHGVTMGGLSAGPFIMAQAGLLDGRRCTLHWEHVPAFESLFPRARVTRSLFEVDGDRITCSGGIASFDMMVALIARDHGRDLAAAVSDWFLRADVRPGIDPHRMDVAMREGIGDARVAAVLRAMEAHLEAPLSRERLGREAGVTPRQLERLFSRHLGRGIHAHYRALRLTRARQLLRETQLSVLDASLATGFQSASHFARAFKAHFGVSPSRAETSARMGESGLRGRAARAG